MLAVTTSILVFGKELALLECPFYILSLGLNGISKQLQFHSAPKQICPLSKFLFPGKRYFGLNKVLLASGASWPLWTMLKVHLLCAPQMLRNATDQLLITEMQRRMEALQMRCIYTVAPWRIYILNSYHLGFVFHISHYNPLQVQHCTSNVSVFSAMGPVQTDANHALVSYIMYSLYISYHPYA